MSGTKRRSAWQRGYGRQHRELRERWQRRIDRGQAIACVRCGLVIKPDTAWDLDHSDDRRSHRGPSHARCNRSAGGKKSQRMRRFYARAQAANNAHQPIIPQQTPHPPAKALQFFNTRGKR
jgi:hypothetical protein